MYNFTDESFAALTLIWSHLDDGDPADLALDALAGAAGEAAEDVVVVVVGGDLQLGQRRGEAGRHQQLRHTHPHHAKQEGNNYTVKTW